MSLRMRRLATRLAVSTSVLLGGALLPAAAQQAGNMTAQSGANLPSPEIRGPMDTAVAINLRRSTLYQQGKTADVASLYTEDATYIELMPVLQIFKGRNQVGGHFEELVSANTVNIIPNVDTADRSADGTILVSGDYRVFVGDDTEITGHFMQILRQQDGAWRIAMHVFARPDPVTAAETDRYKRD